MVLTILVIMVHAAVTYGAAGDWTYVDEGVDDTLTGVLLSLFVIDCQAFFMGLFFFFSGYFTPASYDRKGVLRFWKDRLVHLAIPMALYTWVLSRVPNYLREITNSGETRSFWQYSRDTFWRNPDKGPTWFLFALLAITLGYTVVKLAVRWLHLEPLAWVKQVPAPNTAALLVTALVMSSAMFAIGQYMPIDAAYDVFGVFGLMPAFLPSYVILFAAGTLAYRNDWLSKLPAKMLRFWGWFSVALVLALPAFLIGSGAIELGLDPYLTGSGWRCAIICLWFGFACIGFSVSLTLWMREHVRSGNALATVAGPNLFAIYLVHPLVLVPVCVGLSNTTFHPLIKFAIASVSTVLLCFVLAEGLRRVPVIKEVL
jgi:fucose 4-O-acetylase-like acetyltransferase